MSQPHLPRMHAELERQADLAKLARILLAVGEEEPLPRVLAATAGGDTRRLRGLPAIARGSSGAIPGTDPVRALLAKEGRRRR